MKVEALIERLKAFPPDADVVFDAGQYYDTQYVSVEVVEFHPGFRVGDKLKNVVTLENRTVFNSPIDKTLATTS